MARFITVMLRLVFTSQARSNNALKLLLMGLA